MRDRRPNLCSAESRIACGHDDVYASDLDVHKGRSQGTLTLGLILFILFKSCEEQTIVFNLLFQSGQATLGLRLKGEVGGRNVIAGSLPVVKKGSPIFIHRGKYTNGQFRVLI